MAQKNPFSQMFAQNDFTKAFENFQSMPFDLRDMMETQRKNIQAFSEAQQMAMEGLQAAAQRQSEILSQLVEDNSSLAREMMGEGSPEQKIAKNADIFKKLYEKTVSNMHEISDILSKSNVEASKIINKRVSASMSELKSAVEKTGKKAA